MNCIFSSLPGPPLTNDTTLITLLDYDIAVGLGVRTAAEAQNTRFDFQWVRLVWSPVFYVTLNYMTHTASLQAALEANGRISREKAYALVTTNLEKLLGVRSVGGQS